MPMPEPVRYQHKRTQFGTRCRMRYNKCLNYAFVSADYNYKKMVLLLVLSSPKNMFFHHLWQLSNQWRIHSSATRRGCIPLAVFIHPIISCIIHRCCRVVFCWLYILSRRFTSSFQKKKSNLGNPFAVNKKKERKVFCQLWLSMQILKQSMVQSQHRWKIG